MLNQYNDNELLYMIYEGNEEALAILFDKYKPLIYKRIRAFKIKRDFEDDYLQEGYIALYTAVRTYNPSFNKTFNKFFDLVLQRKFQTLLEANKKRFYTEILFPGDEVLHEDETSYTDPILSALDTTPRAIDIDIECLSAREKEIFRYRYIDGFRIKEIAKLMDCDIKSIYNAMFVIKKKLKDEN